MYNNVTKCQEDALRSPSISIALYTTVLYSSVGCFVMVLITFFGDFHVEFMS